MQQHDYMRQNRNNPADGRVSGSVPSLRRSLARAGAAFLVAAMLTLLPLLGGSVPVQSAAADGRIRIAASFYPLAFFAQAIGGDAVEVVNLVPAGVEPHDWEPRPSDILTILRSDLFVYNGAGFEGWIDRVLPNLSGLRPLVVKATDGIPLRVGDDDDHEINTAGVITLPADAVAEKGTTPDPHVWLDPYLAQSLVENILNGLIKVDPGRAEAYRSRATGLYQRLADLHHQMAVVLTACPRNVFVTSHNAFQYLAARHHLRIIHIAGFSPSDQPSPQRLAKLTRTMREENIRFVYFETLASPAVAETLAQETGARALPLNPIEGLTPDELAAGHDYFTVMQDNVAHLRLGLECY